MSGKNESPQAKRGDNTGEFSSPGRGGSGAAAPVPCMDETASVVNGRWFCKCPGGHNYVPQ